MNTKIRTANGHNIEIDFAPLAGTEAQIAAAADIRFRALRSILDRLGAAATPAVIANTAAQLQVLATHGTSKDWLDTRGDIGAMAKRYAAQIKAAQQVGK